MKQKPPIPFFSNENFEDMIRWHRANILELERERDRLRYILEEAPDVLCQRYGVEPMESIEDTLQAILRADKGYQRELYRVGRIQAFLDSLSPEEEQFVTMRFIKGQQWSELAEVFNVSESTVKKRWRQKLLDRAKKIMLEPISANKK
jgi:DNA-directed RNA polymerase specialized sigma24 family protein